MVEDLADRLAFMTLDIRTALVIGDGADILRCKLPADVHVLSADIAGGGGADIIADEDRLPVADGSCDLVFAVGTLDSVHDLPGALLLIRRALRPGGLFLGALFGGGSLIALRKLLAGYEAEAGTAAVARFHPQIDVRSAGDLLFRAGYSTPVADLETVRARYTDMRRLLGDIRATSGNALPYVRPVSLSVGRKLLTETGIEEQFGLLYLTGWAPVSGEKRPAGPVKTGPITETP